MRRTLFIGLLALASAAIDRGASNAAPPPPPPPGAMERATKIITLPAQGGLPAYLALFSDDMTLSENDKPIVSGVRAWAAYLEPRLGLNRKVLKVSYGNPIMVVEALHNMSYRGPNIIQDCCFWARVSFYHLRDDGKVDNLRVTENGSFWGPPENPEF